MIHNSSGLYASPETRMNNLMLLYHDIHAEEKKYDTYNTLIIGDFNIDPFDRSFIAANTVHAIPFLEEAKRKSRTVNSIEYRMFYNPTWKFLSKRDIPYTTYYYNTGDIVNYYWHMYDQIIIRPQLIDAFVDESLMIIEGTINHKLINSNTPDKSVYSDHLPLFCELKEVNII